MALHLHPLDRPLWEEDLRWALHLQGEKKANQQKTIQDDQTQQFKAKAPELPQDYEDYESDEVIAACTAIADSQKRSEELKKNVIVDVQDGANEILVRNSDIKASKHVLVKARKL